MKKNLGLLAILGGLLTLTYFVHERGEERQRIAYLERHQLFNPERLGKMKRFENNQATLIRRGERFYAQDLGLEVDEFKMQEALGLLVPIQAKRFLEPEELAEMNLDMAFPHQHYTLSFEFENGYVEYLIGEKLKFSQDFYLRLRWQEDDTDEVVQFLIATDTSPSEGVYSKETYHLSDRKYMRLLSLVFLEEDFFVSTRLFPTDLKSQPVKIEFNNRNNRPFSLTLLPELSMEPSPIEGVRIDWPAVARWLEDIESFNAERFLQDVTQEELPRKLGQVLFRMENEEEIELNIHRDPQDPLKFVGTSSHRKGVYRLRQDQSSLFLLSHQRFWDRIPEFDWDSPFDIDLASGESIEILPFTDQNRRFGIREGQTFNLRIDMIGSIHARFQMPATMISQGEPRDRGQSMTIRQQDAIFQVIMNDREVLFYDQHRDLLYHYPQHGDLRLPQSVSQLTQEDGV